MGICEEREKGNGDMRREHVREREVHVELEREGKREGEWRYAKRACEGTRGACRAREREGEWRYAKRACEGMRGACRAREREREG